MHLNFYHQGDFVETSINIEQIRDGYHDVSVNINGVILKICAVSESACISIVSILNTATISKILTIIEECNEKQIEQAVNCREE